MNFLHWIKAKGLISIIIYICFGFVALMVLYLSWVSSPAIGGMKFMPAWVSNWVDSYQFNAVRTAVPLVALGILAGLYLNHNKKAVLWWYVIWMLLTLLVVLAEIGQHFRPMRRFDVRDIFWGSAGAALGLQVVFFLKEIKNYIKRKRKSCCE